MGAGFNGRESLRLGFGILSVALSLAGCAATVAPQLVDVPRLAAAPAPVRIAVVPGDGPVSLSTEVQGALASLGPVAQRPLQSGASLGDVCADGFDLVTRASAGRFFFSSNAAERNTLFIYESVIIVGLPVTAISAYAWAWYGEFTMDGDLETLWCPSATQLHTRQAATIRAEGTGIIAQDELEKRLRPYAATTLARTLVKAAADCGRLEKGGERCAGVTQ